MFMANKYLHAHNICFIISTLPTQLFFRSSAVPDRRVKRQRDDCDGEDRNLFRLAEC